MPRQGRCGWAGGEETRQRGSDKLERHWVGGGVKVGDRKPAGILDEEGVSPSQG